VLDTTVLASNGGNGFPKFTTNSIPGTLTMPVTSADVAFIQVNLIQGSNICAPGATSDNWNIASINVILSSSSTGATLTLYDHTFPTDAEPRLKDHGNGQPWSVSFPTPGTLACQVTCLSGMSCATSTDCAVGTCVGGNGNPGSGCCTETSTTCGCNNDCPSGETCTCPSTDGNPCTLGTCGDTLAGSCL
jgi:hypothetical protein